MPCTTILIGKKASYDGSTIVARNEDSGNGSFESKRLVVVAPEDQPRHYRSVISHVQIDLPDNKKSGLVEAMRVLRNVEDIGIVKFTEKDVVRHKLVQDIIKAYDHYYEEGKSKRYE